MNCGERPDNVSGSPTADRKAAVVEQFRERATIPIATESAAEGVNLQFCSLLVNYDLPWNPQRIEQRIGRCHRYGQKHDVVVVNFLNKRNAADQRVYAILKDKFKLFEGVFGSSDEVLGALESGVDLEKRIAAVYQNCRTSSEIEAAFNQLQLQLDETIQARMEQTRHTLLENFDQEVHERLKFYRNETNASMDRRQKWLFRLADVELGSVITLLDGGYRFRYEDDGPLTRSLEGVYDLDWRRAEQTGARFFHSGHPLAASIIRAAARNDLEPSCLRLTYRPESGRLAAIEPLRGRGGWMRLTRVTVTALEPQDFIVLSGVTEDGTVLDEDLCRRLLDLDAGDEAAAFLPHGKDLEAVAAARRDSVLQNVERKNGALFEAEIDKLERWSDDLKLSLEREVKAIEKEIRDVKRESRLSAGLAERLAAERRKRDLEEKKSLKLVSVGGLVWIFPALLSGHVGANLELASFLSACARLLAGGATLVVVWIINYVYIASTSSHKADSDLLLEVVREVIAKRPGCARELLHHDYEGGLCLASCAAKSACSGAASPC